MSGDVHVRFCVGLGGKFPGPTRLAGTPAGAEASATLYSLVESAKANNLEPYKYLRYLFENLPFTVTVEDYKKLLPSNVTQVMLANVSRVSTV